jgi:hypothetical protein
VIPEPIPSGLEAVGAGGQGPQWGVGPVEEGMVHPYTRINLPLQIRVKPYLVFLLSLAAFPANSKTAAT